MNDQSKYLLSGRHLDDTVVIIKKQKCLKITSRDIFKSNFLFYVTILIVRRETFCKSTLFICTGIFNLPLCTYILHISYIIIKYNIIYSIYSHINIIYWYKINLCVILMVDYSILFLRVNRWGDRCCLPYFRYGWLIIK